MQSGRAKTKSWVLELDRAEYIGPENLMGWTQSGDTNNQISLKFDSLDKAVAYADEKGLEYVINPETVRKTRPRNYGDNFKYIPPQGSASK